MVVSDSAENQPGGPLAVFEDRCAQGAVTGHAFIRSLGCVLVVSGEGPIPDSEIAAQARLIVDAGATCRLHLVVCGASVPSREQLAELAAAWRRRSHLGPLTGLVFTDMAASRQPSASFNQIAGAAIASAYPASRIETVIARRLELSGEARLRMRQTILGAISGIQGPLVPPALWSERGLVTAYVYGVPWAFEAIHARFAPRLRRFFSARRLASAAEDLVQQTFLHVHRARRSIDLTRPLAPWLFTIARHVAIDEAVSRRRADEVQHTAGVAVSARSLDGVRGMESRDLLARSVAGLSALPPVLSEALGAYLDAEGDYGNVVRALGIRRGAARVRVHRAREALLGQLSTGMGGSQLSMIDEEDWP